MNSVGANSLDYIFNDFANEYIKTLESKTRVAKNNMNIRNPMVFVFIGDKAYDSLDHIYNHVKMNWDNGQAVPFLYIYTEKPYDGDNVFSLKISPLSEDSKTLRKDIYDLFYSDENILVELNNSIKGLKTKLMEYGKLYSYFQKVNISVVTKTDDPLNVLVHEVSFLIKSIFNQDFKIVNSDLYGLISEKEDDGFRAAVGVSFLKEIDYFRSNEYIFNKPLMITKEGIEIDMPRKSKGIFDVVYFIGDKNEKGIIPENSAERNNDIIAYIAMIKNAQISGDYSNIGNQIYNDDEFKRAIGSNDAYASAGIAKIERPNNAISYSILDSFYQLIQKSLGKGVKPNDDNKYRRNILKILGLDEDSINNMADSLIPSDLERKMEGVIYEGDVSFAELVNMPYRSIEDKLYKDNCNDFFKRNFESVAFEKLAQIDLKGQLKALVDGELSEKPDYGIYQAFFWTSEEGIIEDLKIINKDYKDELDGLKEELEANYNSFPQVKPQAFAFFNKSASINRVIAHFIDKIYVLKLRILRIQIKQKLLKNCDDIIRDINDEIQAQINELDKVGEIIKEKAKSSIKEAGDYFGQNIDKYYGDLVIDIFDKSNSDSFLNEEIHNSTKLLKNGNIEYFLKAVTNICKKYILKDSLDNLFWGFEDELQQRATMNVGYGEANTLTKLDLFKRLYEILDDNAEISIYISESTTQMKHIEKYLFGNPRSEFIEYCFKIDKGNRTYKLGCISEGKTNNIEKLNIMGGFRLKDIVYYNNSQKYYDAYVKNGYNFHGHNQ